MQQDNRYLQPVKYGQGARLLHIIDDAIGATMITFDKGYVHYSQQYH
jgi:hypothetical protein